MEGKIKGTKRKGKQRRTWTSDVTYWCGSSYTKCVRMAKIERDEAPWQATFLFEDGTYNNSQAGMNLMVMMMVGIQHVDKAGMNIMMMMMTS